MSHCSEVPQQHTGTNNQFTTGRVVDMYGETGRWERWEFDGAKFSSPLLRCGSKGTKTGCCPMRKVGQQPHHAAGPRSRWYLTSCVCALCLAPRASSRDSSETTMQSGISGAHHLWV